MDEKSNSLDILEKIIENNSPSLLLALIIGGLIWIVGGNLLVRSCKRRIAYKRSSIFSLFNPIVYFNKKEWLILLALLIASLFTVLAGVLINQ